MAIKLPPVLLSLNCTVIFGCELYEKWHGVAHF
jgi:hypothetical protein